MSRGQPRRPLADEFAPSEAIRYGDVFDVAGELSSKPVAPLDAATMQSAENQVIGQTQRGGPASVMQSAATHNLRVGGVHRDQATSIVRDKGITVFEAVVDGSRVVTEAVGGQVVGQFASPTVPVTTPGSVFSADAVTIGEALEASALSAGDKPIDQSDAAAIEAAEVRATGRNEVMPGGIGSAAQSAATRNPRTLRFEEKTTLSDVLGNATVELHDDKPVTREDAEGVIAAELRNSPDMTTAPGGVGESMAAAARINK